MGYQEVAIKVRSKRALKKIQRKIDKKEMNLFITYLGSYCHGKKVKYLIFATDRHPGADYLSNVYKNKCSYMNDMLYEELQECYTYMPEEKEAC